MNVWKHCVVNGHSDCGPYRFGRIISPVGLLALLIALGCAPTQVRTVSESIGKFPRPDRILIYDFAVSPEEVQLDTGISIEVSNLVKNTPRNAEEHKVGHAVADALANQLVKEVRAFEIPTERASGLPSEGNNVVIIKGQLISIDEGNRVERMVIGLGRGRSGVQANVQVYQLTPEGMRKLKSMRAQAQSGYKPGMAAMMGVGGLAGHLVTSTVVGGTVSTTSEVLGATVEDDGRRLANHVAKDIRPYFVSQGWIPATATGR